MSTASTLLHLLARQDAGGAAGDTAGSDSSAGGDAGAVDACAPSNYSDRWGLRIGAIFVILVTSLFGTLLPIVLRSVRVIPRSVWEFTKFFGSGVIIATAFIHLLAPAWDALGSECLILEFPVFGIYPWAPAIALIAVYFIFFAETAAYRAGTARLAKLGISMSHGQGADNAAHTTHTHSHTHAPATAPGASAGAGDAGADHALSTPPAHSHSHSPGSASPSTSASAAEKGIHDRSDRSSIDLELGEPEVAKQLVGVAVLEFGVLLHSVIIGLTLAVDESFVILFVVILFHQMFEGLGLGSRLAILRLPPSYNWVRYAAALLYCIMTPIGMAAGLGAIQTFNGNAAHTNLTMGVLDAFSAGILLYTGLVELVAHEILFNPKLMNASLGKLAYISGSMVLGSGLMAMLGRWA